MRLIHMRLAVALVTFAADAAHAAAPVPPELRAEAERAGRARVIVRLDAPVAAGPETPDARALRGAAIAKAAEGALARIGGAARSDLRRYGSLPLLALEVSPRELAELAAADEVLALEPDRPLWPRLAQSIPRVGADRSASAGFDGSGAAVVIVDTGVEATHEFFGGRVVAQACFSAGRDCPNGKNMQLGSPAGRPCSYASQCYHGTHVAGIAAGDNGTTHGVAPGASLISIQAGSKLITGCGSVGSPCVTIFTSDAIAALEYVTDTLSDSFEIAAVNMSFGTDILYGDEASCDAANASFKVAIDAARTAGIATVAAAGNDADKDEIDSPACISSAIAVGATADTLDQVWGQSNSGAPLDLWAPGTNIISSMPGGSYESHSGTSMAAPHVAGAFAVLRQADPEASVGALKSALESTGPPVTDLASGLVRPRIQVDDAVRSLGPAACFDGLDNDSDDQVDVDGDGGTPDPECEDGFDDSEHVLTSPGCGIGPELIGAIPLLAALRARRRNRSPP